MKTAIHETNNPFATFLAGAAPAVVLGLTLALSTPLRAQESGAASGTTTNVSTDARVTASPGDSGVAFTASEDEDAERDGMDRRTYTTTTAGDIVLTTTRSTVIKKSHTGVFVSRTGDGDVSLTNQASFTKTKNNAIGATHSGAGRLTIVNEGRLKKTVANGIDATHSGGATTASGDDDSLLKIQSTANIDATNRAINALHSGVGNIEFVTDASIEGGAEAVYLKHTGSGSVAIKAENKQSGSNGGTITATGTGKGIFVRHEGSVGDIDVDIASQGSVSSATGVAIEVEHAGASNGKIDLDLEGAVSSSGGKAVSAVHNGAGNIELLTTSSIQGGTEGAVDVKHVGSGSVLIQALKQLSGTAGGTITATGTGKGISVRHEGSVGDIDVDIASQGSVISATGNAIEVEHAGASSGKIDLDIEGAVNSSGGKAVSAVHNGAGNIELLTTSSIQGGAEGAVYAKHAGSGSVSISVGPDYWTHLMTGTSSTITATGTGKGIFVRHEGGSGDINVDVTSNGSVTSATGNAIEVEHAGASSGKISILLGGAVSSSGGKAVSAVHNGAGNIEIQAAPSVRGVHEGIFAKHTGSGDVIIAIPSVAVPSKPLSPRDDVVSAVGHGIKAVHEGSGGGILLDLQGGISSQVSDAVFAELKGVGSSGNINFLINNAVSGYNKGISAIHNGTGDIGIGLLPGANITATNDSAIYARHKGNAGGRTRINVSGSVTSTSGNAIEVEQDFIDSEVSSSVERIAVSTEEDSTVSGGDTGISVTHDGAKIVRDGNITRTNETTVIEVGSGSSVSGGSVGIHSRYGRGRGINIVKVRGTVSNALGSAGTAIDMVGGSSVILGLFPGFSLDGKAVASGASTTDTRIELYEGSSAGLLDFNADEFHGFNTLSVQGDWTLTGATSEREVFRNGFSERGVVRFSNLDLRLVEGGYFSVRTSSNPVHLEIAGVNRLRGSLHARGSRIAFVQEEDANSAPTSRPITQGSLTVDGNYQGSSYFGKSPVLGFNVDLAGQLANSLTIKGDIPRHSSSYGDYSRGRVWMHPHTSGAPSTSSSPVQESPTLITVVGTALSTDFWGDQNANDLHHYDLAHRNRTVEIDGVSRSVNQWYFNYAGLSATAGTVASMPQGMSDAMAAAPASSGSGGETPGSGLGLRADTREYVGGVWAQQQSLRVSPASIGITNSRSRTEGNRVHFGYDIPPVNFMGGDMVVGTNVWYGLSTSDVSSPNGEGGIGLESQAAGLTASWQSPVGFYADGYTQYVRFSGDVSAEKQVLVRDNEGIGVSASAEAGYRFALPLGGMDFGVTPQAQLLWSSVDFEDFFGPQGGLISLEDGDLVTGRLGLSWDGGWQNIEGSGRVYGGVNLREALDGRTSVSVSGVSLASEQGLSVDGRLGVSYEWDEGYEVHGEATALRRDDTEEFHASLGVRVDF